MSRWDKEIWTPCRLGERFEYNDLGYRKVGWLAEVKADWMGQGGDHIAVRCKEDCLRGYGNQRPCVLGLEPLPDGKCWTSSRRSASRRRSGSGTSTARRLMRSA